MELNMQGRSPELAGKPAGERIRYFRERAGMSRPVLAGLTGKSPEWVKAVETGRLQPPRLPLLLHIAEVLEVADLSELTGDQRLAVAHFGKARHESLGAIGNALTDYMLRPDDREPEAAAALAARTAEAWQLWHGARRQRTAVSAVLPALLRDARDSARRLEGTERRGALRSLAQAYHLTQLFLSFQPAPDLIMLCGDRAMQAAQDADDPRAIGAAAWYLNHVFRDASEQPGARAELALSAAALLRPRESAEDLALHGLLQLACALSYAKTGREGDAWGYWDEASRAARSLGTGYAHPWLIFGPAMVTAYAVTMHADLMHGASAIRQANHLDLTAMPSATRRSFHLIESARARSLRTRTTRPDPVAIASLLEQARDESPDTARFNLFTRSWASEAAEKGDKAVRERARRLAASLGIAALAGEGTEHTRP
jgi:transcriptional regulator with XRE-family HTH domain